MGTPARLVHSRWPAPPDRQRQRKRLRFSPGSAARQPTGLVWLRLLLLDVLLGRRGLKELVVLLNITQAHSTGCAWTTISCVVRSPEARDVRLVSTKT